MVVQDGLDAKSEVRTAGEGELLGLSHLSAEIANHAPASESLRAYLQRVERAEIVRTLQAIGGDVPAAEQRAIPVSTLYRKIKTFGLEESAST